MCPCVCLDPLCGIHNKAWIKDASVLGIAKHWGNFAFREMLLHPNLRDYHIHIGDTRNWKSPSGLSVRKIPWVTWREGIQGGDEISTAAGAANLRLIQEHLMPTIVPGILESWAESMALFDCLAPLSGGTWLALTSKHVDSHGSSRWHAKEVSARTEAQNNSEVRALVAGDLAVYASASLRFDQVRRAAASGGVKCAQYQRSTV